MPSCRQANCAKNTDIHIRREAREPNATLRTLNPLLSQDYRQVLPARVQVRLLHRYRRTHLMISRRVQQRYEVTIQAFRHREISCEICQSGQGSSQKIWKTMKCWIQIRNVLRKWCRGAQYLHSLPEGPKLRHLLENQDNWGSLQKTHWRSSTSSRKVW